MNRRLFLLGGLAALSACAAIPVRVPGPATTAYPELETLLDVRADRRGLHFAVASRGCASREDFTFFVDRSGTEAGLAVARRRVETCPNGPPAAASFDFAYADLGLDPGERFFLLNPVRPAQASGARSR